MSETPNDVKIALLQQEFNELKTEINKMKDRERNWMRMGLITLGGIVLSLISYIWTHFR